MELKTVFLNCENEWRTGWRMAALIALLFAVGALLNIGWRALGIPGRSEGGPWPFLAFAILIAGSTLGIVLLLLRLFEGRGLDAVGMRFGGEALSHTVAGTALGAVPILLLVAASLIGGYGTISSGGVTMDVFAAAMIPMLITGYLLAGWEELVLRGYLLRQFSIGFNPRAAVVITGVLFGLVHAGNPGANWEGLVYTAVGGILMGVLMVKTGSLWLLIGYHFGWNATAYQLFGLELSGVDKDASFLVATLSGSDWLTGGGYGFEASLPAVVAEVVVLGGVLVWLGRQRAISPPVDQARSIDRPTHYE